MRAPRDDEEQDSASEDLLSGRVTDVPLSGTISDTETILRLTE